jgi:hypothetical protein
MKRKIVYSLIAAIFLTFAAGSARADDEPKDFQLAFGPGFGLGIVDSDTSSTDTDFAWRLHAWVVFYQYVFTEIGYLDFDAYDGFDAVGGVRIPIPNQPIALFAKGGIFLHSEGTGGTDAEPTFGGGVMYDLPRYDLGLRLDYDYVDTSDQAHVVTTSIYWNVP